jgi:hypothetical protein
MTNYRADVDYNGDSRAHEFYLAEALFAVGNNRFEGAEKIRAFYAAARRHHHASLVGNLRVLRDDACCVWSVGVMSLYRADGRPPFQWARPPAMIAVFEAQCVLGDDRCGVFSRTFCDRFSSAATFQLRSRSTPNAFRNARASQAWAV